MERAAPPSASRIDVPVNVLVAVVGLLTCAALLAAAPQSAAAVLQAPSTDPFRAPSTVLTDGGRTVSDGVRSVSASQVDDLDPSGHRVLVSGTGFSVDKGIYVAFCVIPPPDQQPTPCGGAGPDEPAGSEAALWITSNPPANSSGLNTPFGPGGSFSGSLVVHPEIRPGLDCRQLRCAIVVRADHTRTSDRSLDLFLPVTFAAAPPGGGAGGPVPAPGATAPDTVPTTLPPLPSTTLPPLDVTRVAPVVVLAADGRSATDGLRTLTVDRADALDPGKDTVTVTGQGFDSSRGVIVSLCALPTEEDRALLRDGESPNPGPCLAGSEGGAVWVTNAPVEGAASPPTPYTDDGSFEVDLDVGATIDADHDCRTVACGIVVRYDLTAPADRRGDLALPVSFAATSTPGTSATPRPVAAAPEQAASSEIVAPSRSGAPWAGLGIAVLVGVLGAGAFLLRRRAGAAS